ncbi:MAG: hypothetical protein NC912_05185 [Candidatus Omnitrophica bacterium]|nr:hypothetical protein [Candidatus Omnitrophota bacterium]
MKKKLLLLSLGFLSLFFGFIVANAFAEGWLDWIKKQMQKKGATSVQKEELTPVNKESVLLQKQPEQAEKEQAPLKKEPSPEELIAEKREKEKQAKEELNKQEWTIYLVSASPKQTGIQTDVIKFSGERVLSKNLSEKGYPETNYSLFFEADGTIVWETMQGHPELGRAFWRGELRTDGVMQGSLTLQSLKADVSEDFYFTTIKPPQLPEEVTEVEEPKEQPSVSAFVTHSRKDKQRKR